MEWKHNFPKEGSGMGIATIWAIDRLHMWLASLQRKKKKYIYIYIYIYEYIERESIRKSIKNIFNFTSNQIILKNSDFKSFQNHKF